MRRQQFTKQSEINAPVEKVFAFHEDPQVIQQLMPPWERAEILQAADSLQPGSQTIIKVFFGPFSKTWLAEHTEYIPNRLFADIQRSGPFAYWYHKHCFEPTAQNTTIYKDEVEYELLFGWLGHLLGGAHVRAKLQKLFDYRHHVVAEKMKG